MTSYYCSAASPSWELLVPCHWESEWNCPPGQAHQLFDPGLVESPPCVMRLRDKNFIAWSCIRRTIIKHWRVKWHSSIHACMWAYLKDAVCIQILGPIAEWIRVLQINGIICTAHIYTEKQNKITTWESLCMCWFNLSNLTYLTLGFLRCFPSTESASILSINCDWFKF